MTSSDDNYIISLKNTLCYAHPYRDQARGNTGLETALLDVLAGAVSSSSPDGGSSSGKATGSVISAEALDIEDSIKRSIKQELDSRVQPDSLSPIGWGMLTGRYKHPNFSLKDQVGLFVDHFLVPDGDNQWLKDLLEEWERRIRDLVDPPKKPIPMRGVDCPECSYRWFFTEDKVKATALVAYRSGSVVVHCRVCGKEFTLNDLHLFKGKLD